MLVVVYYRPQTKFAKVMFLHLSVILFMAVSHPRGGLLPREGRDRGSPNQGSPTQGGSPGPHKGGLQAHTWRGSPGPHPGGVQVPHQGDLQAHTQGCLQAHTWGVSRPTPGGGFQAHTQEGIPACTEADPPADGYCCGQYASYWNAFLFSINLFVVLSKALLLLYCWPIQEGGNSRRTNYRITSIIFLAPSQWWQFRSNRN